MRSSCLGLACCALVGMVLGSRVVGAQPPPGLYLTEYQDGNVVEILGGGDVSTKPRFATGLLNPGGMCIGPNNDLYVAEFAGNRVMIITAGGDFSTAAPFASGLAEPLDLVCTSTQILVNEYTTGEVTDITAGGNFANAAPFAFGFGAMSAIGLVRDSGGTLWVSTEFGIWDITAGGNFASVPAHVTGRSLGMTEHNGTLLVALDQFDSVRDFTLGGATSALPAFATGLTSPINVRSISGVGLLVTSDTSPEVYDISAGGDFTNAVPYVTGVDFTTYGLVAVDPGGTGGGGGAGGAGNGGAGMGGAASQGGAGGAMGTGAGPTSTVGSASGTASAASTSGSGAASGGDTVVDEGCGCELIAPSRVNGWLPLTLIALASGLLRRRRDDRATSRNYSEDRCVSWTDG